MKLRSVILLAGVAAGAALSAAPASAAVSRHTCDKGTPCIVQSNELGKHRVALKISGQGKRYDFYKLMVRPHGGGAEKEVRLPGGKQVNTKLDLKKSGDYEIKVAGCFKAKKGEAPVCAPSSDKVRLNLR
jgi:hypothetical protein